MLEKKKTNTYFYLKLYIMCNYCYHIVCTWTKINPENPNKLTLKQYYSIRVNQKYCSILLNSAALDTFAKVMKMMNHTELWDAELDC